MRNASLRKKMKQSKDWLINKIQSKQPNGKQENVKSILNRRRRGVRNSGKIQRNTETVKNKPERKPKKEEVSGNPSKEWIDKQIEIESKRVRKSKHGVGFATKKMIGADKQTISAVDWTQFPLVGHLYHFIYDPKYKETLKYYDIFPLTMPLNYTNNGFLGMNFHYLPPMLRAKLFDTLNGIREHVEYRGMKEEEYLKISYGFLKGMGNTIYKPTIKRYLWSHLKSNFAHIGSEEWENVIFLPSEQFKKAGKREVWSDSRRIIGGK